MSKLSASLKALIAAPYARPNTTPASPRVRQVYEAIKKEAQSKNVGVPAWLSLSVCLPCQFQASEAQQWNREWWDGRVHG